MAPGLQARHLQHLGDVLRHFARLVEDAPRPARAALSSLNRAAAFGETRRRARHDGQRRAQVVRYRGQQRAADALGLRFDLERRLFRGLAPHALDEPGNDERHAPA